MPFLPWNRWKSDRTQAPRLADEVERLAADPRVHRLFQWFSSNERDIAELQLAIAAIPAPTFAERARAAWLRERLQSCGLVSTLDAAGNLLALRPEGSANSGDPSSSAPAIAVSAHLDTVFPASTPLGIHRENARLLGPGISDNASGLAALWALAAAFHQVGIVTTAPLLFIANVGEEGEGNLSGMRHLYRDRISAPAVADPTPAPSVAMLIALDGAGNDNIISQALGSRRFEVVISGPGGHSWSDHGAPNPIVAASLLVAALFRIPLPVNPRTTLNVGNIQGGTSINTIPEQAVVKIDLRSSDPARIDDLERHLRQAASEACAETQARSSQPRLRLQHSITLVGERPAGELSANSPLLAAIRAVDAQLGIDSQLLRASTDANIPLSLGLEAISIGAGGSGGGAHTVHEWFDPSGRDQALKRITLLILLLAGLADAQASPQPDASASTPAPTESA
jgi:acetylornithine deacetylase/succinyl-diaminopimelate desuccinylase-like protein